MKIDPYNWQRRYERWKKTGIIKGVSEFNSKIIISYLADMENGFNVARRGSVSYIRLNNLKQRMSYIIKELERLYGKDRIIDISDREVVSFFKMMRDGQILTQKGKRYTSIPDYAAVFKAFWHWYQRVENQKGNNIRDITTYIDTNPVKESEFTYFTIDDLKRMANRAKYEYKVLMWFLFDSGIRAPTELMNIRVCDLSSLDNSPNFQLDIRDEISKTFGRKIKLLLCSKLLKEYIQEMQLNQEDYIFPITPRVVNQYLQRIADRVLGDMKTKGGKHIRKITMYDFRHSSACYWLPRYKSESALKYRFGWKKNDMVHHYTKLLGMRDTIAEDDLLIDSEAKTELEKELEQEKQSRALLQEQIQSQREEMQILQKQMNQLFMKEQKRASYDGKLNNIVKLPEFKGLWEKAMFGKEMKKTKPNGSIVDKTSP